MPSEFRQTLPPETWDRVFSYLSQGNLFSASTVCQTWVHLILPHLYYVIHIKKSSQLELLSKRLAIDSDGVVSSVIKYIRGLEIHSIYKEHISYLNDTLVTLPCLEHFAWRLRSSYGMDILETIDILRTKCLKLNSLHFEHGRGSDLDHISAVFKFRGLRHLSLTIYYIDDFGSECVKRFTSLLRACPDLQTLSLCFSHNPNNDIHRWSLSELCDALGDFTFGSLHSLRLNGNLISSSDGVDSLHLLQHFPALRELVLDFLQDEPCKGKNNIIKVLLGDPSETLERIEIKAGPLDIMVADLIYVLHLFPNLRHLEIETCVPYYLRMQPRAQNWVECMRLFEVACPKLESAHSFWHGKLSRGSNKAVWPNGVDWSIFS